MYQDRDVSELVGKRLVKIVQVFDDELEFYTDNGEKYVMFHRQDCCENVTIDDIIGDLNDLVGVPILRAEKVSNYEPTSEEDKSKEADALKWGTCEWTFYKFATIKGYVDIRWFGESNGFYSTAVDFALIGDRRKTHNEGLKIFEG